MVNDKNKELPFSNKNINNNIIYIQGDKGKLEGLYYPSKDDNAPIILILHGHPKNSLGNNKTNVVQTMIEAAVENNFHVLSINYRGCGNSAGTFLKDNDGLIDASFALDWLHKKHDRNYKFWVAGFSYGSWVAAQLAARRPEIVGLVMVSTILFKFDYAFLIPFPCISLILHGNMDSGTRYQDLKEFFSQDIFEPYQNKINIVKCNYCDHFFYTPNLVIDPQFKQILYNFLHDNKHQEVEIKNYIVTRDTEEDNFNLDDDDDMIILH